MNPKPTLPSKITLLQDQATLVDMSLITANLALDLATARAVEIPAIQAALEGSVELFKELAESVEWLTKATKTLLAES